MFLEEAVGTGTDAQLEADVGASVNEEHSGQLSIKSFLKIKSKKED